MKAKNKYQGIKTMTELEAALRESREKIASSGGAVQESFSRVREFYVPANLATHALRRFALDHHLYTIAINAVSGLKRLLRK